MKKKDREAEGGREMEEREKGKDDGAGKTEGELSRRRREERETKRGRDATEKREEGALITAATTSKLPLSTPCLVAVLSPLRRRCWRTEKERRRTTGRGGQRVTSVLSPHRRHCSKQKLVLISPSSLSRRL
ncbi:hypothetical protein PIB30_023900 [Stylosanthes scabra]|uniref:Uncharacterized protein n=1 Tax=Stylosanthes scabra TaxID=79078 RepID=A0ABU6U8M8_9FABA|nr:hypothetical protein [Stylosanthes scabra]